MCIRGVSLLDYLIDHHTKFQVDTLLSLTPAKVVTIAVLRAKREPSQNVETSAATATVTAAAATAADSTAAAVTNWLLLPVL